jgi:hypothetical protein
LVQQDRKEPLEPQVRQVLQEILVPQAQLVHKEKLVLLDLKVQLDLLEIQDQLVLLEQLVQQVPLDQLVRKVT